VSFVCSSLFFPKNSATTEILYTMLRKNDNSNSKENLYKGLALRNLRPNAKSKKTPDNNTYISLKALKAIRYHKYLSIYDYITYLKNKTITSFDISDHFSIYPREVDLACNYFIRKGFMISSRGEKQ
jgi:hypothetical protein